MSGARPSTSAPMTVPTGGWEDGDWFVTHDRSVVFRISRRLDDQFPWEEIVGAERTRWSDADVVAQVDAGGVERVHAPRRDLATESLLSDAVDVICAHPRYERHDGVVFCQHAGGFEHWDDEQGYAEHLVAMLTASAGGLSTRDGKLRLLEQMLSEWEGLHTTPPKQSGEPGPDREFRRGFYSAVEMARSEVRAALGGTWKPKADR